MTEEFIDENHGCKHVVRFCPQDGGGSTSDFAGVVRNLILDIRDCYRPEVHYMRGPGPKWRAKHQPRLRFDAEAVPPAGQHDLSPVYVRGREKANPAR